jgi:hypothetical protein
LIFFNTFAGMLSATLLAYSVSIQISPCSSSHKVDQAKTTALAAARDAPPKFSNAARAWNHVTRLRIDDKRLLKGGVLVVRQILLHQFREQFRFDERRHGDHTSLTDYVKDGNFIAGMGTLFTQQQVSAHTAACNVLIPSNLANMTQKFVGSPRCRSALLWKWLMSCPS